MSDLPSSDLPRIVRTIAELRQQVAAWRAEGLSVALVPTMGALHEGHLSLMRQGAQMCDRVVATIFVNPTQFAPSEDLDSYPRREAQDVAALRAAGVPLLFAPGVQEMYPQGFSTTITVADVSEGLCGGRRPGHFAGVATVVAKLLLQALPDVAIFGEKDYQQLQVIRRMARDLDIPVRIEGGETVREEDGLALSSRNAYLEPEERAIAPALHRVLVEVAARIGHGAAPAQALADGMAVLESEGFGPVEYLELRDAETLAPISALDPAPGRPGRLLVAAWLGKTRLIDNIAV
ncbi:MAG: pantoate--beta-alanine ligase [Oceanibaculum nanhaiense]|uniref:pantoate--beta-alanine ligase n=1 Tax=Oceanibaculum nanhaiense TaxID=1909734 RepID=UPI0025A4CB03|nr:pantoate--beta-alanine ligase [Oceanibaculum nanhaiense]MDM7945213.1 pantoate--beta-alanine ligase [Oceanibaculum nanhaiense]